VIPFNNPQAPSRLVQVEQRRGRRSYDTSCIWLFHIPLARQRFAGMNTQMLLNENYAIALLLYWSLRAQTGPGVLAHHSLSCGEVLRVG
jgi:hypothetical protein